NNLDFGTFLIIYGMAFIKKVPKSKLLIVGEGHLKSALTLQVQRLCLQDNISFIGNLNDQEYPLCIGTCDVLVLPSVTRQEGFGLTLLEAMACSKPVVGSKISAIPYIVDDGVSGLLAEPGNPLDIAEKICKIITNESLAKKLGSNGRKKVEEKFDWSIICNQINDLLGSIS
ncbi:MAG: glycosyltransferase family 4 protein, partial [Candidatus Thermoplasmatota archaeon]|nr:glycosyltransferase family 4 protein [Candidatus Thermoplasmatota archaeon]